MTGAEIGITILVTLWLVGVLTNLKLYCIIKLMTNYLKIVKYGRNICE